MAGPGPFALRRGTHRPALPRWVLAVIALCCLIEAVLTLCDLAGLRFTVYVAQREGFLPYFTSQRLGIPVRQVVNGLFGFWSEQVHAWRGLYPGQPALMFLTYGFLHGGLLHLGMNMLSLAALARELGQIIGAMRMAAVYLVSQVAAALMFALMAPTAGPMVGASGAIFGLAGALIGFAAVTGWRRRRPLGQLWRGVAMMVVLNVALTVLMPSIAWEAHLGGTLAGLVMGAWMALGRSPRPSTL
ncbi:rhomboid family intramembrane serine protease [Paracoccus sp. SSK6]|uniref:rhomboid family intramembrane serine protease n=1 Tax=Paracoccus sp. SSK6 TaxID=3143131 RepID=UPI003219DF5E